MRGEHESGCGVTFPQPRRVKRHLATCRRSRPETPGSDLAGSPVLANAFNLPQFVSPHAPHEPARVLLLFGIFVAMTSVVVWRHALL
jgi:hypothetical protein